ncbi:hypothetical protein JCM13580A_50450 [Streptomyces drozdowiczii]
MRGWSAAVAVAVGAASSTAASTAVTEIRADRILRLRMGFLPGGGWGFLGARPDAVEEHQPLSGAGQHA